MSLGSSLQEAFAFRGYISLVLIASALTSIVLVAKRSLANRPDKYSSIPLYTPETVAAGNYRKRWSYDNPNALREGYMKVRYPL